jgi:hypothetical protein
MGAFLAVALLSPEQDTPFDVSPHRGHVPAERAGQLAQAQKRALCKCQSHMIWNFGRHLLPEIAIIARNQTRAAHSVPQQRD